MPENALAKQFSVSAPMETVLRSAILESTEFLKLITCLDEGQLTGQVVQGGASALHTGRKVTATAADHSLPGVVRALRTVFAGSVTSGDT